MDDFTEDDFKAMADAYEQQKWADLKTMAEWAKKPIDFTPRGNKHKMHALYGSEGSPFEFCGVTSDEKTCVHVEKTMYDLIDSEHKDDPDFWFAHYQAGNPHTSVHEAEEDDIEAS